MMDRFIASASAGMFAFMVALDAGLPVWRNLPIGDATDFGVTAAFVVWFGIKASAIEARTAETQSGSVHESAVPKGDADA